MREIRTKPGELFNRSLIIRSQRELATLNYFDPEKLDIDVSPNPENGTVDLTYVVEEKSTDQVELQEAMEQIELSEPSDCLSTTSLLVKCYPKAKEIGRLYHQVMVKD